MILRNFFRGGEGKHCDMGSRTVSDQCMRPRKGKAGSHARFGANFNRCGSDHTGS